MFFKKDIRISFFFCYMYLYKVSQPGGFLKEIQMWHYIFQFVSFIPIFSVINYNNISYIFKNEC